MNTLKNDEDDNEGGQPVWKPEQKTGKQRATYWAVWILSVVLFRFVVFAILVYLIHHFVIKVLLVWYNYKKITLDEIDDDHEEWKPEVSDKVALMRRAQEKIARRIWNMRNRHRKIYTFMHHWIFGHDPGEMP